MAQTNFTPILLYASSTPTNVPSAGNLTNSATGSEIAINIADKNLFFKDSTNAVNTVPIRQSGTSSNGWLSATDWNTFNNKAPATSGTSILYGNGSGGFSNVTIGTGISFAGGTLSATGSGGTVTAVTGTSPVVSSGGTTPAISLATAYGDTLNPYASKTANYILAAPNGSAGVPTFRALVAADVTGLGTMATQNANAVAITGGTINGTTIGATTATTGAFTTVTASTSLTTPTVQATNSAGLALKNSAGTTQMSMGAGGGDNISINVSTNLNGTNAQIDISPTGTGHVHIKPSGSGSIEIAPTSAGTINNMVIGGTTPLAITGTTITATTFVGSGASLTGVVTSVGATSPVTSTGGQTPTIAMPAATTSVSGYLTSTDWNTFNNKGSGTVTSVAALTLGTTGTDLSSSVANGTTTPVITLNVPTASAANRGALSAADWTTFNSKAPGVTFTTGYVPFGQGTTTLNQDAGLFWDNTNKRLGIGTVTPANKLTIYNNAAASVTQVLGDGFGATLLVSRYDTSATSGFLITQKARGSFASPSAVQTSDNAGGLIFQAYGGANFRAVTSIIGNVSNYTSDTNISGDLVFSTNNASTAVTERMRIFASGGVSIGNTTDPGATNLSVTGTVSASRLLPTGNVVPTNGMYLPSANILGFSTNTTEAARFDNNQNLLVGTTTTPAGTGGNIRAKYGFVQDFRAIYSGSKSLALSTATNFATFTNPNGGFNMCLKIRVNAYVAGAGADAFAGESSEWIVNFNTYGGTPQTPTLTRLNNQAWQASAFITATYNLTASLSGSTMTLIATQTLSGAGAGVPTGATMFYSIENVMSTGANCVFTAL